MKGNSKLIFFITLATTFASLALFAIALVNGWFGEASGVGDVFCEAAHPGLVKQPANTFSNLGFVAVGLMIAWQLSSGIFSHNNNSITRNTFYGAFFSCLVVLLGPGSMALHATTAKVGGFFDMLSMYLIASFVTAYALQRFFNWRPFHFSIVFSASLAFCLWANFQDYQIMFRFFGNTAFAFFITLTILFETLNFYMRKINLNKIWGFASFSSLITAFIIWNFSITGAPLCDPSSLVQGHAIWHLLCAVSVYCLFRFYASERTDTDR